MPCLPKPKAPIPAFPSPFNLTPPVTLRPPNGPGFCCNILAFKVPIDPAFIPAAVWNPAAIAAIRAGLKAAQAWLDSIPLDCPKE